ncbi:unnamed protein product [Linum tenue]|uniref:Uncharacterized protein n=1 Tax=Linum tenue TaxID=586396 RepID=A0AAV0PA44_9ROSI|nr:unnamed protein product [Linum tenue]
MANRSSGRRNPRRATWPPWAITCIPLLLNAAVIYIFGSSRKFESLPKPGWFPPLWVIYLGSIGSSLVMGLAAAMVWAGGGFVGGGAAVHLYVCEVSLSLVWPPLVVRIGAGLVGWVYSCVHLVTVLGCYWAFGRRSPKTRKLVGPCLGWAGFVTVCTFKLVRDSEVSTFLELVDLFVGFLVG